MEGSGREAMEIEVENSTKLEMKNLIEYFVKKNTYQ